jgi:hypothetical protein
MNHAHSVVIYTFSSKSQHIRMHVVRKAYAPFVVYDFGMCLDRHRRFEECINTSTIAASKINSRKR